MHKNTSITAGLLSVLGGVGVIATSIGVAKETPKANERLNRVKEMKERELTTIEKLQVLLPSYKWSIAIGGSSILCILGSAVLNKRQQASLSSAVAMSTTYLTKYKDKVKDIYGKIADKEIEDAINEEPEKEVSEQLRFYDLSSAQFVTRTKTEVLSAEYMLNRHYILCGEATLNDWYHYMEMDPADHGDDLMWCPLGDDDEWIEFIHNQKEDENGAYIEIEIRTEPYNIDEIYQDGNDREIDTPFNE